MSVDTLRWMLFGVAIPFLVAEAVLAAAWRPWRTAATVPGTRGSPLRGGLWGPAVALAAGFVAGQAWILGKWPSFPPRERQDWLPYLALAGAVLGVVEALAPRPAGARWSKRVLLAGAMLWLLLRQQFGSAPGKWSPVEGAAWLAGLGAALLAFWANLEALAERTPGASLPLSLTVLAGGSAAVFGLSDCGSLAQLGGALAAALGAHVVIALWCPSLSLARGAAPVVTVLLAGLWITGHYSADLGAAGALLPAAAPALLWIAEWGPLARLEPWQRGLLRVALIALPLAAAVALAWPAPETPDGGGIPVDVRPD